MTNCKKIFSRIQRGTAALALCTMLFAAPACAEETVPELLQPVGVKMDTAAAYIGEISKISVYDASVIPHLEELSFAQSGYIDELHIFIGQEFKKGDVIATLNYDAQQEQAENLRIAIEQTKRTIDYENAIAKLDMSILNAELNQLMSASNADQKAVELKKIDIEQKQLDNDLSNRLHEMELEQLEDALAEIEASFGNNYLYAPCDGKIIHCDSLKVGSYVKAYDTIAYLADDSRLYIQSPYIALSTIERAHTIYAQVEDSIYDITAIPMDQSEYMSIAISGGTLLSDFTVNNPDETLKPGKYAAIFLVSSYVPDALIVPTNAIYHDSEGKYVYVDDNGERIRSTVTVGVSTDWYTQILDGLEEGDVVYVKE